MVDAAGGLSFTSDPRLIPTPTTTAWSDGEEIGPSFVLDELPDEVGIDLTDMSDGKVYSVYSDPRLDDTDTDGLTDAEEADFGTRARSVRPTTTASATPTRSSSAPTRRTPTPTATSAGTTSRTPTPTPASTRSCYDGGDEHPRLRPRLHDRRALRRAARPGARRTTSPGSPATSSGGFFVVTDIRDLIGNAVLARLRRRGINLSAPSRVVGDVGRRSPRREVRPPRVGEGRRGLPGDDEHRRMPRRASCSSSTTHRRRPERAPGRRARRHDAIKLAGRGLDMRLLDEAVRRRRTVSNGNGFNSWRQGESALQALTGGSKKSFPPIPRRSRARPASATWTPTTRPPVSWPRPRPASRGSRRSCSARSTRT